MPNLILNEDISANVSVNESCANLKSIRKIDICQLFVELSRKKKICICKTHNDK